MYSSGFVCAREEHLLSIRIT